MPVDIESVQQSRRDSSGCEESCCVLESLSFLWDAFSWKMRGEWVLRFLLALTVLGPWCSGFYVHCFHYYLPGIWEGLGHVGICDSAEASV